MIKMPSAKLWGFWTTCLSHRYYCIESWYDGIVFLSGVYLPLMYLWCSWRRCSCRHIRIFIWKFVQKCIHIHTTIYNIIYYYTIYSNTYLYRIWYGVQDFCLFSQIFFAIPLSKKHIYTYIAQATTFNCPHLLRFYFQAFSFGTGTRCKREIHVLNSCVEHFGRSSVS